MKTNKLAIKTVATLGRFLFSIALLGLGAAGAPKFISHRPSAAQTTGTITGKVVFRGTPPSRQKLDMGSDPVCSAKNPDSVLAEDGAVNAEGVLPNAFVYLKDVPGNYKAPSTPVTLDQTRCMYVPHVLGLMVGQPLQIISSDATMHNVHFTSTQNPDWNHSQPPGAPPFVRKFAHPEIMIKVHCNEHPWMSAYVAVTSNPFYAVSAGDGSFTISNLPPGEYTMGSWTATFGSQDQKVTVRAGQVTQATVTFVR